MEEQLISLKTAILAKEKGFEMFSSSNKVYDNGKLTKRPSMSMGHWNDFGDRFYPAPTQSLLQKWLREKHKIEMYIEPYPDYYFGLAFEWNTEGFSIEHKKYEKCFELLLQGALNLI